MDGENTETPVFGRLDLVFPKFALPRSGRLRGERADVRNHDDRSKIEVMTPFRGLAAYELVH